MLPPNYTKISGGIETWIGLAHMARSNLVSGEIPNSVSNISEIMEYIKVLLLLFTFSHWSYTLELCAFLCYSHYLEGFSSVLDSAAARNQYSKNKLKWKKGQSLKDIWYWDYLHWYLFYGCKLITQLVSVGAALLFKLSPMMTLTVESMNSSIVSTLYNGQAYNVWF